MGTAAAGFVLVAPLRLRMPSEAERGAPLLDPALHRLLALLPGLPTLLPVLAASINTGSGVEGSRVVGSEVMGSGVEGSEVEGSGPAGELFVGTQVSPLEVRAGTNGERALTFA